MEQGVSSNQSRADRWTLTAERALEIYELILSSLDPTTWDVWIKSQNKKMSLSDFVEAGKQRIIYRPEFAGYNPTEVADDSLTILNGLPDKFDHLKNRMEDAFRSILIVNEDMNQNIAGFEQEMEELRQDRELVIQENNDLRRQNAMLKEQLKKKEAGVQPLCEIIDIGCKEVIKLYEDFKKCIGEEEEMKKFLPIFQREVDTINKLIKLKQSQIFDSSIDIMERANVHSYDSFSNEEEFGEGEQEIDDNAVFPSDDGDMNEDEFAKYHTNLKERDIVAKILTKHPEWKEEQSAGYVMREYMAEKKKRQGKK